MNNRNLNPIISQTQESIPSSLSSHDSADKNEDLIPDLTQNLGLLTQDFQVYENTNTSSAKSKDSVCSFPTNIADNQELPTRKTKRV